MPSKKVLAVTQVLRLQKILSNCQNTIARVHVCVCVCVRACVLACVCVRVHAYGQALPSRLLK